MFKYPNIYLTWIHVDPNFLFQIRTNPALSMIQGCNAKQKPHHDTNDQPKAWVYLKLKQRIKQVLSLETKIVTAADSEECTGKPVYQNLNEKSI